MDWRRTLGHFEMIISVVYFLTVGLLTVIVSQKQLYAATTGI